MKGNEAEVRVLERGGETSGGGRREGRGVWRWDFNEEGVKEEEKRGGGLKWRGGAEGSGGEVKDDDKEGESVEDNGSFLWFAASGCAGGVTHAGVGQGDSSLYKRV